jgi:hypothetical protein
MRAAALTLAGCVLAGLAGDAHKPITSPYTYNEDVFPIVRERCGRCHVAGGVAPMSLLTYKTAYPWGESIRTELIAGHMPPWTAAHGDITFKNAHALTARELNILLTWASGGTPEGNAEHAPAAAPLRHDWPLGPPDLVLPLPSEVTVPADTIEHTQEFTLPTGTRDERWVRAVDLLPGTPAIVRSATIAVKIGASTAAVGPERLLALWVPGEDPTPLDEGTAFRLPTAAELVVRINYKKTWEYERQMMSDRSSIGVYFATLPAAEVHALRLAPPADAPRDERRLTVSRLIDTDLRAIALYADRSLADATVHVQAVRPDRSQVELIHLRPRRDWSRRYWFAQPVTLPRGTRIDLVATFDAELLPPGAAPVPARTVERESGGLTLNAVQSTVDSRQSSVGVGR